MAAITRKEICVIYDIKPQKLTDLLFQFKNEIKWPSSIGKRGNELLYNDKEIAEWFSKNKVTDFKITRGPTSNTNLDLELFMGFISGKYDCMDRQFDYAVLFNNIFGKNVKTTTQRVGIPI